MGRKAVADVVTVDVPEPDLALGHRGRDCGVGVVEDETERELGSATGDGCAVCAERIHGLDLSAT